MAVLHLIVGLPCSGKTTYAKRLADETKAFLFTPDVWHIKLFGNDMGREDHDRNHDNVESIMWDMANQILFAGLDVILDFGFWSRTERDDFRKRAEKLGAGFKIHYMAVSKEELFRRLAERNANLPESTFELSEEDLNSYIALFEPPSQEELF